MEKEVLVSVNGIQFSDEEQASMEVINPGKYYYKNNKHYITYEEKLDDGNVSVTNLLKISDVLNEPRVELIKQGGVGTHFIFEKDKRNVSCYETEYGSFMLGFHSKNISIEHSEDEINVKIDYSLEMNYEHVSDNKIEMKIKSKSCTESLNLG